MALSEAEAVVADVMDQHPKLSNRTFRARCLCGWTGPLHKKHLAHEIVERLKEKGLINE